MKLFQVNIIDNSEHETILTIAEDKKQAKEKIENMDWSCLIYCTVTEIKSIDGYKIILEKEDNKE
jgi:hypothetical protein